MSLDVDFHVTYDGHSPRKSKYIGRMRKYAIWREQRLVTRP
jgi:hypothetical protein